MRVLKAVVNTLLGLLLAFDVVMGFQAYHHGWPKDITLTETRPSVERVTVIRHPFTAEDAMTFTLLIGAHLLLIYLVWRFHRRRSTMNINQEQS